MFDLTAFTRLFYFYCVTMATVQNEAAAMDLITIMAERHVTHMPKPYFCSVWWPVSKQKYAFCQLVFGFERVC